MRLFHKQAGLLLASVSGLGLSGSALAQQAPAPAVAEAPTPAVNPSGGLEDIVVTARKRVESVQDVPVAITAFSPAQIQRYDISSAERIAASTPNLTIGKATTGAGAQIALRGIGTPGSALGIESSTAIIVDGVYYGNGRILNEGFFDLARIEVLKGPQALFFGKNATAGVISITSAGPTDHFYGSTKIGYEFRAKQPYLEQVVSGPLTDTLAYRVALRGSKMFGGYAKNNATPVTYSVTDVAVPATAPQTFTAEPGAKVTPKELEFVGRITLEWKPIDGLTDTLKASGNYDHVNDPGWNNIVFSCATGFSTVQPGVPCQRKWSFYHNQMPAGISSVYQYASKDGHLFNAYKSFAITNNLEYKLDHLTFTSTTNYQDQRNHWQSDSDYQERTQQIYVVSKEHWRVFSEEARVQTSYEQPINAMVGVLYQRSKLAANQNPYQNNQRDSTQPPEFQYAANTKISTTNGETISPFAQVIWKIVPTLEVTGGVRYTHETKNSYFIHPVVRPGQNYFRNIPVFDDQLFTAWTPEVTASYKPNRNVNIYGSFKTGYKSGGFNNETSYTTSSSVADLDFDPEKARGFEGGVKLTMLDNQLRFNVAAYTYKYSNLQVDFFEAQSFRAITTNAAAARTRGVELSSEFAPRGVPGLSLRGSLNYNRARYLSFIAPCNTGQTPAQGCNTTASSPYGGLFIQDLAGKSTANAPKWTGSLGATYERHVSDRLKSGVSADARYSARYNASPFNNPLAIQPKYVNLDAQIFLRSEAGWELSLIGRNLTNQFVISGALDTPATGSGTGTAAGVLADQRGYANTPRTVQLQLTLEY